VRHRILLLALFTLLLGALAAPAMGQSEGRIDVIELEGVIDGAKVDYLERALQRAADDGAEAAILKIDSPGAVEDAAERVEQVVANRPLPVVAWVGDTPARALGVAARLVCMADVAAAAPGTEIGWISVLAVGGDETPAELECGWYGEPGLVEEGFPSLDRVDASLGQLVVWLDGQEIGDVVLETAEEVTDDDGTTRLQQTIDVRFVEPNLWIRTLNAALSPEALFFFIAAGLTIAAFEFYAIGPGVAAGTALLPILVGAYGVAQLPLSWTGVGLLLLGLFLLTADYQAGRFRVASVLGALVLVAAGRLLVDGGPTLQASWAGVIVTVISVGAFYAVAMPVVARSRFSTGTFGRDHLIGRSGVAVGPFSEGAGIVDLGGAKWQATAHRESEINDGDALVVAAVRGLWLEVEAPEDTS
jgi:membrane-bound serine protease (ClpP class)